MTYQMGQEEETMQNNSAEQFSADVMAMEKIDRFTATTVTV